MIYIATDTDVQRPINKHRCVKFRANRTLSIGNSSLSYWFSGQTHVVNDSKHKITRKVYNIIDCLDDHHWLMQILTNNNCAFYDDVPHYNPFGDQPITS